MKYSGNKNMDARTYTNVIYVLTRSNNQFWPNLSHMHNLKMCTVRLSVCLCDLPYRSQDVFLLLLLFLSLFHLIYPFLYRWADVDHTIVYILCGTYLRTYVRVDPCILSLSPSPFWLLPIFIVFIPPPSTERSNIASSPALVSGQHM